MSRTSRNLHFPYALLPTDWHDDVSITTRAGRIAIIESEVAPHPDDERHAIAIPGMPNLHSRAFRRGMAGLAEVKGLTSDNFWTWRETMYHFVDAIGPDTLLAIAARAYVEMLESGFTRVGEFHYLHHDRAGAPYADRGTMSAALIEAAAETGAMVARPRDCR